MEEIKTNEMRYGISALSMEYKEQATNDELLLDPNTGKPYYKREDDGQIVSFDDLSYSQSELPMAISTALINQSLDVNTVPTDFVAYNTIDVASKVDLFKTEVTELSLDTEFINSSTEAIMYVRVYGDVQTNAIMSYLDEAYNKKMAELPEDERTSLVEVTLSITSGESTTDVTVNCKFNTLIAIPLNSYGEDTYKVKIKSIKSNISEEVFNELASDKQEIIKSFNNGNEKLEITNIDVVSYISDTNQTQLYDTNGVKLKYILPMTVVTNATSTLTPSEGDISTDNVSEEEISDSLLDTLKTI